MSAPDPFGADRRQDRPAGTGDSGPAAAGPPAGGARSRRAARWLRWALLAATVGLIVRYFVRNREQLRLLGEIEPADVVLLVVLSALYLAAQAERYRLVLAQCGGRALGVRDWFELFILGRFLNTVLPQAGNLYRGSRLKRDHGISYTRYLSGFFSLAWLDTCLNLLLAALVLALFAPRLRLAGLPAPAAVAALALAAVLGPVALDRLAGLAPAPGRTLTWLRAKVREMLRVTLDSLREPGYLAQVTLLGLVTFALAWLVLERSFASLGVELGAAEVVVFLVLLKLASHVNLTPGNLGVLELGFGLVGQQMALGLGAGVLAVAVVRVVGGVALAALAVPMGGLRLARQLRRAGGPGGDGLPEPDLPGERLPGEPPPLPPDPPEDRL